MLQDTEKTAIKQQSLRTTSYINLKPANPIFLPLIQLIVFFNDKMHLVMKTTGAFFFAPEFSS
jgi:hypothetical protein